MKCLIQQCSQNSELKIREYSCSFRQFNATRIVAEDALKAANVYENIKDAVHEAEQAAEDSYTTIDEAIADVIITCLHSLLFLFEVIIFFFHLLHSLNMCPLGVGDEYS